MTVSHTVYSDRIFRNIRKPKSGQKNSRVSDCFNYPLNGGAGRNRTGVHGVAVRCKSLTPQQLGSYYPNINAKIKLYLSIFYRVSTTVYSERKISLYVSELAALLHPVAAERKRYHVKVAGTYIANHSYLSVSTQVISTPFFGILKSAKALACRFISVSKPITQR